MARTQLPCCWAEHKDSINLSIAFSPDEGWELSAWVETSLDDGYIDDDDTRELVFLRDIKFCPFCGKEMPKELSFTY